PRARKCGTLGAWLARTTRTSGNRARIAESAWSDPPCATMISSADAGPCRRNDATQSRSVSVSSLDVTTSETAGSPAAAAPLISSATDQPDALAGGPAGGEPDHDRHRRRKRHPPVPVLRQPAEDACGHDQRHDRGGDRPHHSLSE